MLASNANFCYSKLLYGTISLTNGSGFEWVSWSHLYSSNYNWMLNSMSAGEKCIDSWLKLLNLLVCSVFKSLLRSKRSCLWCGSITITFSANVKSHIWDKEPNTIASCYHPSRLSWWSLYESWLFNISQLLCGYNVLCS